MVWVADIIVMNVLCHTRELSFFIVSWKLGDINRQRDYVHQHTVLQRKKIRSTAGESRRKNSMEYYMTVVGIRIRVCKTFFLRTLDITDRFVHNVKKLYAHGFHTDQLQI